MNAFGVATWAWRGAVVSVVRPVMWLPFLVVAGVQAVVLGLIVSFYHPLLLPIGLPLIKLLGGEQVAHYPTLYYALPTMFDRANLAIEAIVVSVASGAATVLFARGFGMDSERGAWSRAIRCAPALIVVGLLTMGVAFGLGQLSRFVPRDLILRNSMVRWGTRGAVLLLFVVIQSLLAYATAWIVLMGHKVWPAIRDSLRVTSRTLLPTLIVVGVPAILLLPLAYASSRADLIASKLKPEMVAGLLTVELITQALVTFLLIGAVTRLFLWRMEANR